MTETFPPSNLSPDAVPWGRKVEESVVRIGGLAESLQLDSTTLFRIQESHGAQIAGNNSDRVRDIKAVNDELSRRYLELKAVNDQQNVRLGQHAITLGQHGSELWTILNVLIPGLTGRVGSLENKLNLTTASSINGLNFIAHSGNTWYSVPQSVGSPLGGPIKWPFSLVYASDRWGPSVSPGGIGSTFHRAVDFSGGGLDIRAAGRGTVIFAGDNGGLGNHIEVRHSPTLVTGYSHIAPGGIKVSVGQAVAQGQSIAVMGTTGTSTGVHLHFATTVNGVLVNPETLITGDDHL